MEWNEKIKEGDKVIIKDNLENEFRRLAFDENTCKSMAERFVGTEQEVYGLFIDEETGQKYVTVDLCIVMPIECVELIK